MSKTFAYVSCWNKKVTEKGVLGINAYEFDEETGKMKLISKVEEDTLFNVSFYDSSRGILYALNETDKIPERRDAGGGRIFAFKVDSQTGELTEICRKNTWGSSPSYICLDESGKYLIVSHHGGKAAVTKIGKDAEGNFYPKVEYDDTNVVVFEVNEDGTIGKMTDCIWHEGDGPEKRQAHPHPHSAVKSPLANLYAVCDKGNDTVRMYGFNAGSGKLIPPKYVYQAPPAMLPRYCVYHPDKFWFYNNNENTSTLSCYEYDSDGVMKFMGNVEVADPNGEMVEKTIEQQGLVINPEGKYIYDILRGQNVVSVLEVGEDGMPVPVQYKAIPGQWPRGCAMSPDGRFLVVTALTSGNVIVYPVGKDGCLKEPAYVMDVPFAAYTTFCRV